MVILDAVQGILSIIIMIALGYFLSSKGWFPGNTPKLLTNIVVKISLPAYMISNLVSTYDKSKLMSLKNGLFIPFSTMVICYGIAMITAKIIRVSPGRQGTFSSMLAFSNTIFVGLPVNLALFGEESVPFVLLYYIANTVLFWTVGSYGISRDGGRNEGGIFSLDSIKRIFSPPLLGFIIGIILVLLNIKLPGSIMDTCKYLGNLTTPLSMLFIGIVIYSVKLRDIRVDRGLVAIMIGRFLLAPLLVIAICRGLTLPLLMKKVFVIQAAMPVMTQTSIVAKSYDADYEYAALVTAVTTVASLISIPFYMLLLSSRWLF